MKQWGYIVVVFLFCALTFGLQSFSKAEPVNKSEKYRVIKVNGKIVFIKTGTDMKIGDYFVFGTPIQFSTLKDRAAIFSKEKGRFILQPNVKGKAKVLSATSNISVRGTTDAVLLNLLDVQNYFSGKCLFINETSIRVGMENFQLNDKHFFYVTYMYNGEKIAKKIPEGKDNSIIISEAEMFKIDGKPVEPKAIEMQLFYQDGDAVPKPAGEFTPVFPDNEVLKQEVTVLLEEVSGEPFVQKEKEIIAFLNEFYGRPQTNNLRNWLDKEFKLKMEKNINFK